MDTVKSPWVSVLKKRLDLVLSKNPVVVQTRYQDPKEIESALRKIAPTWGFSFKDTESFSAPITIDKQYVQLIPLYEGTLLCCRYNEQQQINGLAVTGIVKANTQKNNASIQALSACVVAMMLMTEEGIVEENEEKCMHHITTMLQKSISAVTEKEVIDVKEKKCCYRLSVTQDDGFWFGVSPWTESEEKNA